MSVYLLFMSITSCIIFNWNKAPTMRHELASRTKWNILIILWNLYHFCRFYSLQTYFWVPARQIEWKTSFITNFVLKNKYRSEKCVFLKFDLENERQIVYRNLNLIKFFYMKLNCLASSETSTDQFGSGLWLIPIYSDSSIRPCLYPARPVSARPVFAPPILARQK